MYAESFKREKNREIIKFKIESERRNKAHVDITRAKTLIAQKIKK